MFLILFHGQSEVERRFNINKQLLVENLKTKSLVALRRIEDDMNFSELSPETTKISNEFIESVKEAYRHYQDEPVKQRKQKQELQKSLKCNIIANEINVLKEKLISFVSYYIIDIYLVKLISEIEVLRENAADLLTVKVEKLLGFRYLTQSNQQKKFADEKQKEVTELQK